jgi:LAS superfamily LD-carboxypeptidase LdcB
VSSPYPTILLCQLSSISGSGDGPSGATVGGGVVVNKQVAAAFQAMGEAAKAAGVPLSGSSFRLEDSCSGTGNGTACAKPGQSPHQIGIAIDFSNIHTKGGSTTSCSGRVTDPAREWGWLHAHAASEFGIKQYSYEAWHWDASNLPNRCP